MNGGHVNMAWVFCRRYRLFLAVFLIISVLVVYIKAETVTELFSKRGGDFCESDDCSEKEKTLKSELRDTAPVGGLGSQSNSKLNTQSKSNAKQEASAKDSDTFNAKDVTTKSSAGKDGTSPPNKGSSEEAIHLLITFTNAANNIRLQDKFTLTVSSILKYASVPLAIHVIGDEKSQTIAGEILQKASVHAKSTYTLIHLDVDKLAMALDEIVRPMQDHFSFKPGAYYNHALFFLSIGMHLVMPENMTKVVMIDCDLKFKADIKELHDRFQLFTDSNIMAIGRDLQPVYRHTFWSYRRKNPGTRVGEPPPNGLTGFNSGVLLLDLVKMRNSKLYNSLLNRESLSKLAGEFDFKGHLGDQDFFTLLSMKYEELFHVLPCNWNRQLCTWWKDKGYQDVFDLYFNCQGDVKIYHGNCGTPIPED